MSDTLIEMRNVNKVYDNGTVGLKDINLKIPRGQFVVIVGLSGAGKSTLLRTINRMHDVTSGNILINGESIIDLKGKDLRKLRRKIGMIFQNFNLVKRSTVKRNVLSGRVGYYPTWKSILGIYSKKDQQKAIDALKQVKMLDKIYAKANELSGGQQQRVAIARALMQDPEIMLADEPIASLDPFTTKAVMDELKTLNQDYGITVLVNLHSVSLAMQYADRIVDLRAGELVYDKLIDDVVETDFDSIYQSKTKEVNA